MKPATLIFPHQLFREWCKIWDGLYWRFIHEHRDFFKKKPRMKVMINQIDPMGKQKMKEHLAIDNSFLENL